MENETQDEAGAVETQWQFDIGASVEVNGVAGEVVWRRENAAGARDYEIKTADGQAWHQEVDVK